MYFIFGILSFLNVSQNEDVSPSIKMWRLYSHFILTVWSSCQVGKIDDQLSNSWLSWKVFFSWSYYYSFKISSNMETICSPHETAMEEFLSFVNFLFLAKYIEKILNEVAGASIPVIKLNRTWNPMYCYLRNWLLV